MSFRHPGLISPELRQTLEEQQLVAQTKATLNWASRRTPFANLVNLIELRAKSAMDLRELDLLKYPFNPAINGIIMLMDSFVRIDATIKNKMQDTFGVGALNLHGLEDHPEISSIKIYTTLLPMHGTHRNTPMIIISYRNKAESEYYIAGGNFRNILREECKANIMSTNTCEIYTTKRNATSIDEEEMQVRQLLQWGVLSSLIAWEDVPAMKYGPLSTEETLQPKFYYDQVLDPIVLDKFVKHAPALINSLAEDKTINILDVGAGKGRLAKKIIAEASRLNLNVHYYFLEPNKMQINQAKKDLANEMKAERVEITFINNELMGIKFKNNKKMHCIISAGGPLNREVATHEGAKTHIGHMYSMMAEQGILIAVGMTAFVVKSDHFKEKGFSMLSYTASLPEKVRKSKENLYKKIRKEGSTYEHVACYVCQKPATTPRKEPVQTQDIYRHLRAILRTNPTVNPQVSAQEEKEEKLDKKMRIKDAKAESLELIAQVLKAYPKAVHLSPEGKNSYLVSYCESFLPRLKDIVKDPEKYLKAAKTITKAYRHHLNKEAVNFFMSRHKNMAIKKTRMERFFKCGQFDRLAQTSELAHGMKQETLAKAQALKELGAVKFRAQLKK